MINVLVLVFDEVVPSSVTGVIDLLSGANRYLAKNGKPIAFNVETVAERRTNIFSIFCNY